MRQIGYIRAFTNLVLTFAVLGLAVYGASLVARRHWQWQRTFQARAEFEKIGGLAVGDKVHVQGVDAGIVEAIEPPSRPGNPVVVRLRIDERLRPLVRSDATATIVTQGVVGTKALEITPGQSDAPLLADGGLLRSEAPTELGDILLDARSALKRLDTVAHSAEVGLTELNDIAATIRQGKGTLGRLVKDEEAYERLVALSNRGERALVALDDNLEALKGVWPFSRYFDRRGFNDFDRVLYQPGSTRERRTLQGDILFEPGTAILTENGRGRLDEFAHWFKKMRWPSTTEIVIAAFSDRPSDIDLARILTQEQADAVRKYLLEQHQLATMSWFRSRKVAAVGFGHRTPPGLANESQSEPPRRVEIILFTPQA